MNGESGPLREMALVGTVAYQRSVSDGSHCLCCAGGRHVCGYGLDLDPEAPEWVRSRQMDTAQVLDHLDPVMFLYRYLRQQPEGARVKVTLETIWTPDEPAQTASTAEVDGG